MLTNDSTQQNSNIQTIVTLLSSESYAATNVSNLSQATWEEVAITAIVTGLGPLLHWHIEQQQIDLPPLSLAKLAVTRQAHAKRNQAIAQQLAEILAECEAQKIPVIVLKGVVLASLAYPDSALRPMNDIDLLFQPDDIVKVGRLLQSLGYHGKTKDADQGPGVTKHLSTYRRNGNAASTPNPYLSTESDRMVEPHLSLEESWFGLKVDITPGVWQRAVPLELHGQPVHRLATADMLLHLTVHAAFHVIMGSSVFVQLYDIGRVIETWSDELDWLELLSLTYTCQAQPFVYAGLYWAKHLFGANVPDAPLHALQTACPTNLDAYIQSMDASGLFYRTQQPPLSGLMQRVKRGLADRQETARWASSLAQKWKVWQTALTFHKTDTAALLTGRALKAEA